MSIQHLEDLALGDFIRAVKNISLMHASEKLDGANLWMGLDDEGRMFTSREGKSNKASRFYTEGEYPYFAAYNGFRAAHAALEKKIDDVKRIMQPGQMVEMEILYGRQPNAVTYGADGKSYIAFLRGVNGTPNVIADQLEASLGGQSVTVDVTTVDTTDGENLETQSSSITFQFTGAQRIDPSKLKDVDVNKHLEALQKFLEEPAGIDGLEITNYELVTNSLGSIKMDVRPQAKELKKEILAKITTDFKLPIKKELLANYVSKIKPALQDKDVSTDEDVGIEGVVLRDPTTGDLIKLVDKDNFTTINAFNHAIRNQISNVVKTLDGDAPLESRGGITGNMKIQIADLLGNKELARGAGAKKALGAVAGATAIETVKNFAAQLNIEDFQGTKRKILALVQQAAIDLKALLTDFNEHKDDFQLKLKNGRVIGITPEIEKRTLLVFAETRKNIVDLFNKLKKCKTIAQIIAVMYGSAAQQVHATRTADNSPPTMNERLLPQVTEAARSTSDADRFIHDWTYSPEWHRNNPEHPDTLSGFNDALKAYPYENTTVRLYRGLSFKTEADRDAARAQLSKGKLSDKSLSSWSQDRAQAATYAAIDDDYGDDIIPGFVVSMLPPKGTKMVDASQSSEGEYEIIVAPGTYDVRIEEGDLKESLLVEKRFDTDKARYAGKDAFTLLNIYFATVLLSVIIYETSDDRGMRLLKDKTHFRLSSWSKEMSPLNFWGYPIWKASTASVKKLIGNKVASQIFKVARRATPSQPLYLHMDLSFGKDVPIRLAEHRKTLKILQQFEGLNIDRINTLMDGVFNYNSLTHDEQVKVLSKLFYYVQQFIPTSPLFARLKIIQDNLLLNANGENDLLVKEMKLLASVNSLVEDEVAAADGASTAANTPQVDLATKSRDTASDTPTIPNKARMVVKRKRNPNVKKAKFPKPEDSSI